MGPACYHLCCCQQLSPAPAQPNWSRAEAALELCLPLAHPGAVGRVSAVGRRGGNGRGRGMLFITVGKRGSTKRDGRIFTSLQGFKISLASSSMSWSIQGCRNTTVPPLDLPLGQKGNTLQQLEYSTRKGDICISDTVHYYSVILSEAELTGWYLASCQDRICADHATKSLRVWHQQLHRH